MFPCRCGINQTIGTVSIQQPGKVLTAVASELVEFIWAIGSKVEREALAKAA